MTSLQLDSIASTPDWAHGRFGPLVLTVWRGRSELEHVHRVRATIERALADQSGMIAVVAVVEPVAEPPSAPVRDAIASMLNVGAARVAASALVYEGDGFRAAAVRSIVTGLSLMARHPYPHKVFAGIDDASQWVAQRLTASAVSAFEAKRITDALQRLRAAPRTPSRISGLPT